MTISNNIHGRNLRNNLDIQTTANHYRVLNKVLEKASIVWNSLKLELKQTKNRNSFKREFEKDCIASYNE